MAPPPDTEVDPTETVHDVRTVEERAALPTKLHDRYEVGALLGEGGMGEVLECRDIVMDRPVALKTIRRDRYARQLEARFVREACVQAQLEHPGVVPVFDVARAGDGSPFFTMRKVDGITLDQVLERLRAGEAATALAFTRHRLLTAFTQACLTVDYAHARGVLHRDIKPANIMFGDFGEVYVLDWGVAKLATGEYPVGYHEARHPVGYHEARERPDFPGGVVDTKTQAGAAVGTMAYMAPEQVVGGELDARADVFALGAVLFEILALEPLFDDAAVAKRAVSRTTWDARPSVRAQRQLAPPEFDAICARATADSPARRYPSARALHDVVEAFLGGERDVELRKQLARSHYAAAEAARDPDVARRELQRALALDPEDPRGLELLVELSKATPAATEEARGYVVSEGIARLRRAQPLGALLFTVPWLIVYPAICLFTGVSNIWLALVPPLAWCVSAITVVIDHQQGSHERVRYPTYAIMLAIALSSIILGPFFVLPPLAVSIVTSHVLISARRLRGMSIVLGSLTVIVPTALAWLGIHDVYRFASETTFTVDGIFRSAPAGVLGVVLTTIDVVILVSCAIFASEVRDEIERARTDNVLFAWQLTKLLPLASPEEAAAAPASEPDPKVDSSPALRMLDTEVDASSKRRATSTETQVSAPGDDHDHAVALRIEGLRYEPMAPARLDGSAEVTACLDRLVGREVAMKRRPRDVAADAEAALMGEALLQARLDHPGIPPVYDCGHDALGPWFTSRLAKGTSLTELVGAGRPSEHTRRRALTAFAQVCLTVDFAHARGIVHGALEPSRIVLGAFGEVYVLGWGGAPTRGYAAPEQAGGGRADPRADVFALGAVLFEVLCGEALSGASEELSVALGKYDARPSARGMGATLSPEVDDICVKATAYDPADRYPTARDLHDALEASMSRDRDEVLRRAVGVKRLERATQSADRAMAANDERARIEALRELGSALALLPDRAPALRLLERLFASPPSPLPADVVREIAAQTALVSARAVPAAAKLLAFVAVVVFPLHALAAGVRDRLAAAILAGTWAVAAATAYAAHRIDGRALRMPSMVMSFIAVAATSLLFGPYILGPPAAIALAMAYVLGGRLEWRRRAIALGCVAVAIPAVLTWVGVLDGCTLSTTPGHTVTVALRGAIYHPPDVLLGGLLMVHFLVILIGAFYGTKIRDALADVEAENRAKVLGLSRLLGPDAGTPR